MRACVRSLRLPPLLLPLPLHYRLLPLSTTHFMLLLWRMLAACLAQGLCLTV